MKDKILMLIIGILIGAIIASAGFLIFGGKNNRGNFNPENFKGRNGDRTPPSGFSGDFNNIDFNNIDLNNIPGRPEKQDNPNV